LRVLGRIERTLFTLQWLSDPALRQRSHAGLNKGEASNSLRRAVFFHRQGEIRHRTFESSTTRAATAPHWSRIASADYLQERSATCRAGLIGQISPIAAVSARGMSARAIG
jgi:hypothetical protein